MTDAEILMRLIETGVKAGYKSNELHSFAGGTLRWMREFLDNQAPAGPEKRAASKPRRQQADNGDARLT